MKTESMNYHYQSRTTSSYLLGLSLWCVELIFSYCDAIVYQLLQLYELPNYDLEKQYISNYFFEGRLLYLEFLRVSHSPIKWIFSMG